MAYSLQDKNFENLKKSFKTDTGLDVNDKANINTYIAYYQAKMIDYQMQILASILTEIANRR